MKKSKPSNLEIAQLCQSLSLLLHAGVNLGDGLSLLAQEETGELGQLLSEMGRQMDGGASLAAALKRSGQFPVYVSGLVEVGERTGRTEEALRALARYYESREQMDRQVRNALTYPAILLLLMLVVIVVLLSQVLPVFDDVYASLGGRLTGVAGGLLLLGRALDGAMPALCVLLAVLVAFLMAFALSDRVRDGLLTLWRKHRGDTGVSRQLNNARFAQALAMGLSSGLALEEAVNLSAALLEDVPGVVRRCQTCAQQLSQGGDLAQALGDTGMLPLSACRLLTLGFQGGSGDAVMGEIAQRLSEEAQQALERKVAQVEPTLVLVTSLLVGAILLSVMLPLMHIMSAIG